MSAEEAKRRYREVWLQYRETPTDELARELDDLQPHICRGPCPEWDAFVLTIPGYIEFWNSFRSRGEDFLRLFFVENN
jgi:hypothetical protein